jgi:NADPH:quinone reductase
MVEGNRLMPSSDAATMLAVEIQQPGGPEMLVPVRRTKPVAGAGEVLIEVRAAGVNRPDVLQRQGNYKPPPGTMDIPGLEVAGTVVDVGSGVEEWRFGDQVCALLAGGGYAEMVAAPAPQCLPIPRGLTLIEAAAVPETFFTVWSNIFERGRLQPGETLLMHGGASGIGSTAIQLASATGARVFATAGDDEKCRACEKLGAERCINYRTDDFVKAVLALTGDRGVDVIADIVGGDYFARNLDALATEGRLVQIGILGGAETRINLLTLLRKRLSIMGSVLRARTIEEKGRLAREVRRHVWPLFESGKIRPPIHRIFSLERAGDAHRLMEASGHIGKIVLSTERNAQ